MISIEYLRHFRISEYAIFDLALTFLGMYLASFPLSKIFLKFKVLIPRQNWLFLALPIGIAVHLLIGRFTPMTKNFLDLNGYFGLKVLIFSLLFLGLRNIKIIKK